MEVDPFNQDVLDDASTHRAAWEKIFDTAISVCDTEDDRSYVAHEKSALLRLLNAINDLGWFTSVTYDDGECELFVRPKGMRVVSGAGRDNTDAAEALVCVLADCLDGTLEG